MPCLVDLDKPLPEHEPRFIFQRAAYHTHQPRPTSVPPDATARLARYGSTRRAAATDTHPGLTCVRVCLETRFKAISIKRMSQASPLTLASFQ